MPEATPEKVKALMNKLMMEDFEKYQILEELRKIVHNHFPQVTERMMYGGIMLFDGDQDFGGLFAYKNHVSFEYGAGSTFHDPENFLEGNGKFRRHLKIKSLDDIENKDVNGFVVQAREAI